MRTIMRMRFLGLLTITVSFNPFPATVLILIITELDPDAFTPIFRILRVVPDLLGTIFLNLAISLLLPHLFLFHFFLTSTTFTLLNKKNKVNKINLT